MARKLSVVSGIDGFNYTIPGHSKTLPTSVLKGGGWGRQNEDRRGELGFLSRSPIGSAQTQINIVGFHEVKLTSQTIGEFAAIQITITNTNGRHIWVELDSVTTFVHGTLTFTGDSVDETGTVTVADTEDVVFADSTVGRVIVTDKRWEGSVVVKGLQHGFGSLLITVDAGTVDPFNASQSMNVIEAFGMHWLPNADPWRFLVAIQLFSIDNLGGGGLSSILQRDFATADTPTRAQIGNPGTDWNSQIDAAFNAKQNDGIIMDVLVRRVDEYRMSMHYYER